MSLPINPIREPLSNWSMKVRLTLGLLSIWMGLNIGVIWYAEELNAISIIGPAGFYMAAQGAPICYLLLIWWYARRMNRIDGVTESSTGRPDVRI